MFEYKKDRITIEDPIDREIISEMNEFGRNDWEIFSISEKVVEQWTTYGEPHEKVEYTMYMKRQIINEEK